jgi:hypothetical protein
MFRTQDSPPLVNILRYMNPVQTLLSYLLTVHIHTVIPSRSSSSWCFLPIRPPYTTFYEFPFLLTLFTIHIHLIFLERIVLISKACNLWLSVLGTFLLILPSLAVQIFSSAPDLNLIYFSCFHYCETQDARPQICNHVLNFVYIALTFAGPKEERTGSEN